MNLKPDGPNEWYDWLRGVLALLAGAALLWIIGGHSQGLWFSLALIPLAVVLFFHGWWTLFPSKDDRDKSD